MEGNVVWSRSPVCIAPNKWMRVRGVNNSLSLSLFHSFVLCNACREPRSRDITFIYNTLAISVYLFGCCCVNKREIEVIQYLGRLFKRKLALTTTSYNVTTCPVKFGATCPSVIFLLAIDSRSPCLRYLCCWLSVFGCCIR